MRASMFLVYIHRLFSPGNSDVYRLLSLFLLRDVVMICYLSTDVTLVPRWCYIVHQLMEAFASLHTSHLESFNLK